MDSYEYNLLADEDQPLVDDPAYDKWIDNQSKIAEKATGATDMQDPEEANHQEAMLSKFKMKKWRLPILKKKKELKGRAEECESSAESY